MGLQSWIAPEGRMTALYVSHQDVARATEELEAYDSENPRPQPAKAWLHPALPRAEVAFAYWALLLFFFAAARNQAFAFDWVGEGAVQSARMFNGEWWRAVTALCLHTSGAHIALQQARRRDHAQAHIRNWVPVAGGLALLGFLGVSGENTDIVAHMTGFASGIAAGLLMARWDRDWTTDRGMQWWCAGMAVTLVASSWALAALA